MLDNPKYNTSSMIREEFYMNILFCGISFLMGTMSQSARKQEAVLLVLACLRADWFMIPLNYAVAFGSYFTMRTIGRPPISG